jgi:hypothetical protein
VEYLRLGDRETSFAFEVKICTSEEAGKYIKSHWEDYYEGILSEDKDEDDADAADLVKPARDAFLALFADVPQFENEQQADSFLGQAKSIDDPRVLLKLLRWGRERYDKLSQIVAQQKLTFYAHTTRELFAIMEPYLQTAEYPHYPGYEKLGLKSSVWPFVRLGR